MTERWKAIPGYEGYEVSDMGRVRSYWKPVGGSGGWCVQQKPQRLLSTRARIAYRYPAVHLKGKIIAVHHLVMLAFVGPRPDDLQVCHNDGNPQNNNLSNLRYDTAAANTADAIKSGALTTGPKLDFDDASIIRLLAREGAPRRILADIYGVSATTIGSICRFERYAPHRAIDDFIHGRENENKTDSH